MIYSIGLKDDVISYHWFTDPPTQEGWYWFIANVAGHSVIGGVLHFPYIDNTNVDRITHWLGPLPVPEAPGE